MDFSKLLAELKAERDRIDAAISALKALAPIAIQTTSPSLLPAEKKRTVRQEMSPAGRKKIAEAQRAKWAKKKAVKPAKPLTSTKQPAPEKTAPKKNKRDLTAAAHKLLSDAAKARSAAKKKTTEVA